jgi:hypothetical protein
VSERNATFRWNAIAIRSRCRSVGPQLDPPNVGTPTSRPPPQKTTSYIALWFHCMLEFYCTLEFYCMLECNVA